MASVLALIATGAPLAVHAQDTAPAAPAADTGEVVVITSQRRRENLQKTAVSAVVLTSNALDGKGISNAGDLQYAVPSLSFTDSGFTQNVNIRGVGLSANTPSVANGVATYVDGVFQPPIVTTNSFYDTGSVEVFRGPQGTFVGSNSTGGAIFINTQSPKLGRHEGYGEVSTGSFDFKGFEGAVNLPLGETLAVRVAVNARNREAFFDDLGPNNNQVGRLDETGARIGILWKPTDAFQALFKHQGDRLENGGFAFAPIAAQPYGAYRSADRTVDFDEAVFNNQKAYQDTLELKYAFDNGITLRSMSGYQSKSFNTADDYDATNAARYTGFLPRTFEHNYAQEQIWTQELNLISPTTERFSWIAGVYYQRNKINSEYDFLSAGFPTTIDTVTWKKTTGIFAQLTYKITPTLAVDVGARHSTYEVEGIGDVVIGAGIPGFPPNGLAVASVAGQEKDSKPTGKISLNWTPNDDNLVYAFVARGYKSGGFSSPVDNFKPETVTDYEAGWKSSFGPIQTQVGAFYYDYKNFQYNLVNPGTGVATPGNIADATIKGVEASFQGRFGKLKVDGGASFVNSELGEITFIDLRAFNRAHPGQTTAAQCPPGVPDTPGFCYNYAGLMRTSSGKPNLYSPELSYNLGIEYAFEIGDATFTPRLNYAYVGDQWTYLAYDPATDRIEGYGLWNALATYRAQTYSLEIYATNLTDQSYVSGQYADNEFYGSPRQVGVRLRLSY
ncbi:hypothetical protein ABAC460_15070 [Asticcacaulis sp. AC460]|nr:hypothetical protein ABAC460_15070 [Asticcacaulis sp. AC460]